MAKESRHRQSPDAIKREIAQSRDQLVREFRGLRYELDIPRRIRRSFREQTGLWIGAAVIVGGLIVFLPARKREVHVDLRDGKKRRPDKKILETGVLFGLLKLALPFIKPMIANFITQRMRGEGKRPAGFKW
jgi:hypothetical protein